VNRPQRVGWAIDDSCINCDVSRQLSPGNTRQSERATVITRQPATPGEELGLWQAALACPVAAVRPPHGSTAPPDVFPLRLEEEVYQCGYNSRETFGASAYFLSRPEGNLLIDAPRWSRAVAAAYEERGGVAHILVTHRDHVPHAARYAEHFGARLWIHEGDAPSLPGATDLLRGREPTTIQRGVVAFPVPGHTQGSTMYLADDRFCFTGDSLYWSRSAGDLEVFETVVWYSRSEQLSSLERLAAAASFQWVLPGHGDRRKLPAREMSARLAGLVRRMRDRPGRPLDLSAVAW
jgi:glyoxylase-like metal-dependent hydrolase (beta-lactamase superfamily II)